MASGDARLRNLSEIEKESDLKRRWVFRPTAGDGHGAWVQLAEGESMKEDDLEASDPRTRTEIRGV